VVEVRELGNGVVVGGSAGWVHSGRVNWVAGSRVGRWWGVIGIGLCWWGVVGAGWWLGNLGCFGCFGKVVVRKVSKSTTLPSV
jgi:hypothetical protein